MGNRGVQQSLVDGADREAARLSAEGDKQRLAEQLRDGLQQFRYGNPCGGDSRSGNEWQTQLVGVPRAVRGSNLTAPRNSNAAH